VTYSEIFKQVEQLARWFIRLSARLSAQLGAGLLPLWQRGCGLIRRTLMRCTFDVWSVGAIAIALLVATPILFIASSVLSAPSEVWGHLAETVLSRYLRNSIVLAIGVSTGVIAIGVSTAWLVSTCEFGGRRIWEGALLFPLAAPAYLLAYTYTDFLEFSGPVQTLLRHVFGWEYGDYWFPNVRSIGGAILLLALTLYPYVYLLARVAFLEQSLCTLEASRILGCSPWRSFWTVALPLARPAIAAGTALALMETLNDFGTVQYFGVDTFTTGIYRTWFAMGDRAAATQLAAVLLVLVFGLLALERRSRRDVAYYQVNATHNQAIPRFVLSGWRQVAAWLTCGTPVVLGFLIPALVLLEMAIANADQVFNRQFWTFAQNSLLVASVTAILAVFVALFLAYSVRLSPRWFIVLSSRIAAIGYAIPGAAIAVGVLIPAGLFDNTLDAWLRRTWGISSGLILSGTMFILVFAYLVRFLAVSYGGIEASLGKIAPSLDEASRNLGTSPSQTLFKIHIPLLRGGMVTAAMTVFVDVMKELPATLALRPFNFDTLAVRIYSLAADERLAEASGLALALVAVGMIPTLMLGWQISRSAE